MYLNKIFKTIKPITASQRQLIRLNKKHLNKKPLLKNKIIGKKNITGKNNSGKITVYHKGGGVKKKYRIINFNRTNTSTGIVCSIEHDPNRNSFIAAVFNTNEKKFFYIILPKDIKIGDIINSGLEIEPNLGNSLPLSTIPEGSTIHNISLKKKQKITIIKISWNFFNIKKKI